MIKKVLRYYNEYRRISQKSNPFVFIYLLYLSLNYKLKFTEFCKKVSEGVKIKAILVTTNKYKRKWKLVSRAYMPNETKWKMSIMFIEFSIMKLLYPGLDAMDYFQYQFYNLSHRKRKTFITEGYLAKLNEKFNGNGDASILSDKCKFNTFFSQYIGRKWIETYEIQYDELNAFLSGFRTVIVKPYDGAQGKGIFKADVSTEQKRRELFNVVANEHYLIEEIVQQHADLDRINPSSVNTLRIYSVIKEGNVTITGTNLRIGSGEGPTDNYSLGGLAVTVDTDSGVVISTAKNRSGHEFYYHPLSGQKIIGLEIPNWGGVIRTVKEAHLLIPKLRYVAWDVVVCENEDIVFLEANTGGGVNFQQGPMLSGKKQLYESLL